MAMGKKMEQSLKQSLYTYMLRIYIWRWVKTYSYHAGKNKIIQYALASYFLRVLTHNITNICCIFFAGPLDRSISNSSVELLGIRQFQTSMQRSCNAKDEPTPGAGHGHPMPAMTTGRTASIWRHETGAI